MNDYNRGLLKDPCLRLSYGFEGEYSSVELGDGTGFIALADYYEEILKREAERNKMRTLIATMWGYISFSADKERDIIQLMMGDLRELGFEVE
jgi:hypothetical protein